MNTEQNLLLDKVINLTQQCICAGNTDEAYALLSTYKQTNLSTNDTFHYLEASLYKTTGKIEQMRTAIYDGLSLNPHNYKLYYLLATTYFNSNPNQAYLCIENAIFYCQNKDFEHFLFNELHHLKENKPITVKPVSIIIVSFNLLYMMQKNIECIRNTLPKSAYQICVIDNASSDGTAEWLAQQPDIWLMKNIENKGFAPACNQAVSLCLDHGEFENDIYLLNNDTRLCTNTLFWLRMGLYENEKIGATGSISNYAGNNQQIDLDYSLPTDYLLYGEKHNIPLHDPYEERVRLSGFSMLIKRNVWHAVNGMDESFAPGYFEDDDLSINIRKAGYRLFLCKNSFLYHAGSQSFSNISNLEEILLNHYSLFITKHGFPIIDYATEDIRLSQTLSQIENRNNHFSVLEIHCGLGANLFHLADHFPNAVFHGQETDMALYQVMQNCHIPVYHNLPISRDTISYNYIIIPTSYYSPEQLLILQPYLAPDGLFLVVSNEKITLIAGDKI